MIAQRAEIDSSVVVIDKARVALPSSGVCSELVEGPRRSTRMGRQGHVGSRGHCAGHERRGGHRRDAGEAHGEAHGDRDRAHSHLIDERQVSPVRLRS